MLKIEMPKIAVEENEERSYAKVVVEPLEKGFGLTIGNALRRILLSALPGVAIQNIKFSEDLGIKHEFSAVPLVKEDVTEIILNLKLVAIKSTCLDDDFVKTVRLYKEGPAVVKAGDILCDSELSILNPDLYICTVDEGGKVDIELDEEAKKHKAMLEMGHSFLEMPLGTGDVNFDVYLPALKATGYDGYLTIEREVGADPTADIAMAVDFLREKIAKFDL